MITHHIANMVCNIAFVAHDCADLLSGYSPFLFPTLSATEAQHLVSELRVWDAHITKGSCSTNAKTKQAAQLAQLSPLVSFVDVFAMLCRNEVLLAVLLHESHQVVTDPSFLQQNSANLCN